MFFSALLFSMMSFAGVVTFGPEDFLNQGTTGTGSYVEATKDGVTVSCDKGFGNTYALRCYKEGVVTISASETISSLAFTFDTYNNRYYNGDLEESYTVGATSWSATLTNQARFTSITVTLGEGGETPEEPETPVTPENPEGVITCAEAVAICEATGETATTETYTIRGYVTEIKEAYTDQYKNVSCWMADEKGGGQVFLAFRVKPINAADQAVKVNDYIEVTGNLVNYYGNTPETTAGGSMTIITAGEGGETPEEPETPVNPGTTTIEIPAEAQGWNIPAEAIDVLQARAICAGLASGETTGTKYYVMGYVKKIHSKHADGVANFGNAQFYMENVKGANSQEDFMAYQVYGPNGEKITDPNAVAVGDFVVVYGELTNYMGSTYETVGKGAAYIWNSTNPLLAGGETPDTDVVNVKDLSYADAYYYEYEGVAYYDIDLYKGLNPDTYEIVYPEVYLIVEAKSKTALNGTYDLLYAGLWTSANDSIEMGDEVGTLTIKNTDVEGNMYSFIGSYVGTDGKTYKFDQVVNVYAMDADADYEEIILTEETTDDPVTPPTPPTTDGAVTFDADVDQGNASETVAAYEVAKNGVTMAVSSGRLGIYNDETHYRIYKNQTLTLTSTVGNIVKVEFTCTANDDAQYGPGCFTVDGGDYTYAGPVGTWTGSASEIVFSASVNQVRATQVVVTLESTGTGVEDVVTVEVPVKVIENGQLMIIRGENVYNVLGAQVK